MRKGVVISIALFIIIFLIIFVKPEVLINPLNKITTDGIIERQDILKDNIIVYTPTSETYSNPDGTKTTVLYSGVKYVEEDKEWKKLSEARSLKDKGFNIWYLESDVKFPLEVIDFNYTSITINTTTIPTEMNKEIPIRIWSPNDSSTMKDFKNTYEKVSETTSIFSDLTPTKTKTYDFSLNSIMEFGYSSTTIKIYTNLTQSGDCFVYNYSLQLEGYGDRNMGCADFDAQNLKIGVDDANLSIQRSYLWFNLSDMPQSATIESVELILVSTKEQTGYSMQINLHEINDTLVLIQNETSISWLNQTCGNQYNDINDSCSFVETVLVDGTYNVTSVWNVTQPFKNAYLGEHMLTLVLSNDTHYGGAESLRFASNENISDPTGVYMPNLNITYTTIGGESGGLCYQESANVSTECGGLDTGLYVESAGWTYEELTYDEDWDTEGYGDSGGSYIMINYSKPENSINNGLWEVKDGTSQVNLTITDNCWNYDLNTLQLQIFSRSVANQNTTWYCYDGDWFGLRSNQGALSTYADVYEEGMWWDIQGDICKFNGLSDMEVNCTNCWIPTDTNISGDLTILNNSNDKGRIYLNSTLWFNGTNQKIVINPHCSLETTAGGRII